MHLTDSAHVHASQKEYGEGINKYSLQEQSVTQCQLNNSACSPAVEACNGFVDLNSNFLNVVTATECRK